MALQQLSRRLAAMAVLAALAACGGGGGSAVNAPPPTPTPTPTATPMPNGPSGAWVLGENRSPPDTTPRLKRFDGTLTPVAEISGSNSPFTNAVGIDTDTSGNVYVLRAEGFNQTQELDVYPPSADGNVAPASSTQISVPVPRGLLNYVGLALDAAARNAYFIGSADGACTVYRTAVNGTAATAVPVADCFNVVDVTGIAPHNAPRALHFDAQHRLYIEAVNDQTTAPTGGLAVAVARFDPNPDGTFTRFGEITEHDFPAGASRPGTFPVADFAVDRNGNVLLALGLTPNERLDVFPASAFVANQNTTPARTDTYAGGGPVTIDPNGTIYAENAFVAAGIVVIPSGSHTAAATSLFLGYFMAPVVSSSTGSATIIRR
jgi:hypothetical protein